jgi:hypothetical protein
MRVFSCLILTLILIESSFSQVVVVKQVVGNVEFVVGERRTIIKDFSTFSEKKGIFILKDKNSQLFIRIGDKLDLLTFSEDKHRFSLIDLIDLKQDSHKKEEEFLDKFFSMFSVSHDDDVKINGMMVANKSGISRGGFNDTNIILLKEKIIVMAGYPLKINFGSSIDSDKIEKGEFNILVKDHWTKKIILNKKINETYLTINDTAKNFLSLNWDIEINNISFSKKIKGTVKSLSLNSAKRKLFDQLKDKAIAESKTDESTYQIIFIESLRSSGLLANARYYLDLFIETNNNSKLINYKNHYTNNQN